MLIGGLVVVIEVLNVVVSGGQVVLQRLAQQLATIAGLPSPVVQVAWQGGKAHHGTRSQESKEANSQYMRVPEEADADQSEAVAIERRRREGAAAERWQDLNADAVDGRYYGVAVGKAPGVYTSWALARQQVHRVSGNSHRCFTKLHYALGFIREHQVQTGIDEDILQYDNFGNVIARWRYAVPLDRVNGNAWSQRYGWTKIQ